MFAAAKSFKSILRALASSALYSSVSSFSEDSPATKGIEAPVLLPAAAPAPPPAPPPAPAVVDGDGAATAAAAVAGFAGFADGGGGGGGGGGEAEALVDDDVDVAIVVEEVTWHSTPGLRRTKDVQLQWQLGALIFFLSHSQTCETLLTK